MPFKGHLSYYATKSTHGAKVDQVLCPRESLQETQPAGNALFGLSVPFADFTSLTFAADTSHLMREHQR